MNSLAPLTDTPSLDKLAYQKIKQAILTFQFLPNQNLVEGELAAQLGISKTPVRDALMRLEREGLVMRQPYKGTFVTDINKQDMVNIFEIRVVLEGLAVRLAVDALTPADFNRLEHLLEVHERALQDKNYGRASEINNEFHGVIIGKCSNARLQEMLMNLDDHLKRYRLLSVAQGTRMEKSIPEHRQIFEALRAGDATLAEQSMKQHLSSAMWDLYDQDFEELEQQLHTFPVT
jgi:DNA-binding GntR family transcriptional regulator